MSPKSVLEKLKQERLFSIKYMEAEFQFELPDLSFIFTNIANDTNVTTIDLALKQIRGWKNINEKFFIEGGSDEVMEFDIELFEYFLKDHPDLAILVLNRIQELCVEKVNRRDELKKLSTSI